MTSNSHDAPDEGKKERIRTFIKTGAFGGTVYWNEDKPMIKTKFEGDEIGFPLSLFVGRRVKSYNNATKQLEVYFLREQGTNLVLTQGTQTIILLSEIPSNVLMFEKEREQKEEPGSSETKTHINALMAEASARTRASVLAKSVDAARAEQSLHSVLSKLLSRAKDHPELIDALNQFLGELSWISNYGHSADPLPSSARKDIMAGLTGASLVLALHRGSTKRDALTPDQADIPHVEHFLELVGERVGYVEEMPGGNKIITIHGVKSKPS